MAKKKLIKKKKAPKVTQGKKEPVAPVVAPTRALTWQGALKRLRGRLVKIRTPQGHGTGFHIGKFGASNQLCAIATALHVVEDAHEWGQPIKLVHAISGKEVLVKDSDRAVFSYKQQDLAIITFVPPADFELPDEELEHIVTGRHVVPGVDIGWCGFPGVRDDQLCFFHGYVSCYLQNTGVYLVDGVAINGVSGGPVFYIDNAQNKPIVAGVITAYIANRATGATLPGLSMIASVVPYEETVKFLRNLREAKKAEEEEKIKKEQEKQNPTQEEVKKGG